MKHESQPDLQDSDVAVIDAEWTDDAFTEDGAGDIEVVAAPEAAEPSVCPAGYEEIPAGGVKRIGVYHSALETGDRPWMVEIGDMVDGGFYPKGWRYAQECILPDGAHGTIFQDGCGRHAYGVRMETRGRVFLKLA